MNVVECSIQRVWIQSLELCKRRPIPRARRNACTSPSAVIWANSVSSHQHHMQNKFDGLPAFIVLLERMWFPDLSFQFLPSMSSVWNITCHLDTCLIFVGFFFSFRFPIPHWHNSGEKRSWLPGQRSRGTSVQVTRCLIDTVRTSWVFLSQGLGSNFSSGGIILTPKSPWSGVSSFGKKKYTYEAYSTEHFWSVVYSQH